MKEEKSSKAKIKKSKGIKKLETIKKVKNSPNSFNFLSFMHDFTQALLIVAVIILLTVSFMIVGGQKKIKEANKGFGEDYFSVLDDTKVIKKNNNFFGNIFSGSDEVGKTNGQYGLGDSEAGMSAGAGAPGRSEEGIFYGTVESSFDISFPAPEFDTYKYNYNYTGGDFSLFPSEVNVLRRINPDLSKEFVSSFSNKKISFFDMKKFKNLGIHNLTINEDVEYGYSIYLGLKDGTFSIYKNWDKWPNIDSLCRGYDSSCYQRNQLSIADMLSDEEITSIADQFLENYGISLENYGAGEVQNYWMENYLLAEDKTAFYIPETISVIYPLKIEGKEVYEEYGQKSGLTVEVDVKAKKGAGVYNLFYQHYESSAYNSETDKNNILEKMKQGGMSPDYYYQEGTKVKNIDVEIGNPSLSMVKLWYSDSNDFRSYEIYVPAYVFPVLSVSDSSYFYKKNIIVPAVKEFFNRGQGTISLPAIMEDQPEVKPSF